MKSYQFWMTVAPISLGAVIFFWADFKFGAGGAFGTSATVLLALVHFLWGWENLPADPPFNGIPTILGEMKPELGSISHGWKYLPGRPLLLGVVQIDATYIDIELTLVDQWSKDDAPVDFETSLTLEVDPRHAEAFIRSGRREGVRKIIKDMLRQAVRKLVQQSTWKQLLKRDLLKIAADLLQDLTDEEDVINPARVRAAAMGHNGDISIAAHGVKIRRVNTPKITIKGKVAEAAQRLAIERLEAIAERREIEFIQAAAAELVNSLGISGESAVETLQVERSKVTKEIQVHRVDVARGTLEALGPAASFLTGLLARKKGKKGKKNE